MVYATSLGYRPPMWNSRASTRGLQYLHNGMDPAGMFEDPHYAAGTQPQLNVFYFMAKTFPCQIADIESVRLYAISKLPCGEIGALRSWVHGDEKHPVRKRCWINAFR